MFKPALVITCLLLVLSGVSAQAYDFSRTTFLMQQLVNERPLDGAALIVMRDGAPILSEYFGSYTAQTREPIASASKWISASVIASLVDSGQMRWEDTVGQYFPNAPADKTAITLAQLFSHSSGLVAAESSCLANASTTLAACAQQILATALLRAPGTCFSYGGNSMQVAGRMAELASGRTWDQLFIERIAGPLGMASTDYGQFSTAPGYVSSTNPRIGGGVRSTAPDLARFMQMIAQNGSFAGAPVLSAASVDALERDQTGRVGYVSNPDPTSFGYGLGVWRNRVDWTDRATLVSSGGAFGTWPWVDRSLGIGGVFFVRDVLREIEPSVRRIIGSVSNAAAFFDPLFDEQFDLPRAPPQPGCVPL